MSDVVKLSDQTDRGQRAAIVLKELGEVFEALEADCFDTFKSSKVHDIEGQQTCRIYLKVLEDVRNRFEYAVNNGEAARKALAKIK